MGDFISRTHFLQTKESFNAHGISAAHAVREIPPTQEAITSRVGRIPWNWINKEIYDDNVLLDRISRQRLRLFEFTETGNEIGYCIAAQPEPYIQNTFLKSAKQAGTVEIENIALFPEYVGNGRGRSIAKLMMRSLFNDGHEQVYLNCSETNFPTLPKFYERIGMTNLGEDEVPDFNARVRGHALELA